MPSRFACFLLGMCKGGWGILSCEVLKTGLILGLQRGGTGVLFEIVFRALLSSHLWPQECAGVV